MQITKCKNCGAQLDVTKAKGGVVECEYCHSKTTLAKSVDASVVNFLAMGEHDLDTGKFDDAYAAYAKAAELDKAEPEAYFGMALAANKVKYIKDYEYKRLQPICYDAAVKSFAADGNYLIALSLATAEQKIEYARKAAEIDYIRKEFYAIGRSGKAYDCFICVKVSGEDGRKTIDSDRANDIYYHLKDKGYRPFYSEREIQNKQGADYEARILYALISSPCMLVVASDESYLNTPFVNNEYSRFIDFINNGQKGENSITIGFFDTVIERLPGRMGRLQGVCLKNPDAYSKIVDFVNDNSPEAKTRKAKEEAARKAEEEELKRKLEEQAELQSKQLEEFMRRQAEAQNELQEKLAALQSGGISKNALESQINGYSILVNKFLADGDFGEAEKYCDYILALDGKNPEAHMYKLLASLKVKNAEALGGTVRGMKFTTSQDVSNILHNADFSAAREGHSQYSYILNDIYSYLGALLDRFEEKEAAERAKAEERKRQQQFESQNKEYILQNSVIRKADKYDLGYNIGQNILVKYTGNRSDVYIPYGTVAGVGDRAFENHTEIKSISVGVKITGSDVFAGCTNLEKAELSAGKSLPVGIFRGCEKLSDLKFPLDITQIESDALKDCTSLSLLEIPFSVKSIGDEAFVGCKSLTSLKIPRGVMSIGKNIINGSGITEIELNIISLENSSHCFSGCTNLRKVEICEGVFIPIKNDMGIAPHMFENCVNLESIDLSNVDTIGECAFRGCSGLKKVVFGNNARIEARAFENCSKLEHLDNMEYVKYISIGAFRGCAMLDNITVRGGVNANAFADCHSLATVHVGRIFSISSGAFKNCTSLTTIDLSGVVYDIAEDAFIGCDGLVNVTMPKRLKKTAKKVFGKEWAKRINITFTK